jgi:hypothetical protein
MKVLPTVNNLTRVLKEVVEHSNLDFDHLRFQIWICGDPIHYSFLTYMFECPFA